MKKLMSISDFKKNHPDSSLDETIQSHIDGGAGEVEVWPTASSTGADLEVWYYDDLGGPHGPFTVPL